METAPREVITKNRSISGVVLLGLVLLVGGIVIQDPFGVNLIVAGLGIALLIAGVSYAATKGKRWVALANAFVSLIGAQLLAFGGIVRLLGGVVVLTVVISVLYSRL
ncbi:hypothetical protein [Halovenus halobia]|uniref:hypothetical protein n=1 Tax=Halovenus halobia TaxID=3396622 RepID=UPI003F55EA2A